VASTLGGRLFLNFYFQFDVGHYHSVVTSNVAFTDDCGYV